MSEKNDGGQAFPIPAGDYNGTKCGNKAYSGMTLRDYFAGQAIQGTLPGSKLDTDEYARLAYRMADAMLRAREA